MKKRVTKSKPKSKKSKTVKPGPGSGSLSVAQDIMGLLTMLVQKLTSFETKIDTVLGRLTSPPAGPPRKQPAPAFAPEPRRDTRPSYKAVCADCGRDCEVPFRPSGNRPVYCRECFAKRKNKVIFKTQAESRPKEPVPASVPPPEEPKVKKTSKAPAPASKKKKLTTVKKKKKAVRKK